MPNFKQLVLKEKNKTEFAESRSQLTEYKKYSSKKLPPLAPSVDSEKSLSPEKMPVLQFRMIDANKEKRKHPLFRMEGGTPQPISGKLKLDPL